MDQEVLEGRQCQIPVVLGEEGIEVVCMVAIDMQVQPAHAHGMGLESDNCSEGRKTAFVDVVVVAVAQQ